MKLRVFFGVCDITPIVPSPDTGYKADYNVFFVYIGKYQSSFHFCIGRRCTFKLESRMLPDVIRLLLKWLNVDHFITHLENVCLEKCIRTIFRSFGTNLQLDSKAAVIESHADLRSIRLLPGLSKLLGWVV